MKVLLVDDLVDNRIMLRHLMQSWGFTVEEAADGLQALDQARSSPPDLIISDILMPQMDGFTLCLVIKQIEPLREIPFVFYTATYVGEEDEALGLALGASLFIRKPEKPTVFLQRIDKVITQHQKHELPVQNHLRGTVKDLHRLHEERIARKLDKKILDITRLHREQAMILDSANEGILVMDMRGKHINANEAAARILGYKVNELIGRHSHSMWHHTRADGSPFPDEECPIYASIHEGRINRQLEDIFWCKDGGSVPVEYSSSPLLEQGEIQGVVVVFRDITERHKAEADRHHYVESLKQSLKDTVHAMARAMEVRYAYTSSHQVRTSSLSVAIATKMGLDDQQVENIALAAMIHDIGMIAIPADLLNRPTRLTEIEFNLVKEHSLQGYNIVKDIRFDAPIADMIRQHHERLDGSGYPDGLSGDQILLESRIISVADVVAAMTSHRPYRSSQGIVAALEEIQDNRSKLYDPHVVDACVKVFREDKFLFD